MYKLINCNYKQLFYSINPTNDIQLYVWLINKLHSTNVTEDIEFQKKYRRYWQLNPARLSDNYLKEYFSFLEHYKSRPDRINLRELVLKLYQVPTHNNGRKSLQFSFATKLVHMINMEYPIYDKMVDDFYFLPNGKSNEITDKKLERLLSSYEFLDNEYQRILNEGLLNTAITKFREHFHVNSEYTDKKIIDTIIWKFVIYLRGGAIKSGKLFYD